MDNNEFDRVYNDDASEEYICADTQARNSISTFDYKITCVQILNFSQVVTISGVDYNVFNIDYINITLLKGKFNSAYDGSCIRGIFNTYAPAMDTSKPIVFRAYDQSSPPQRKDYIVYTDANRSQTMQNLYDFGKVMDFVFDKTYQCFYLVGVAGDKNVQSDWSESDSTSDAYIKNKPSLSNVATSGDADDVSYDNTSSGMGATNVQDAIDSLHTNVSSKIESYDGVGNGSFSIGRKDNTTIGSESATLNVNCEASGVQSFASGYEAKAQGNYSRAEGYFSVSSGVASHAENRGAVASGDYSHCEGHDTEAASECQHVSGKYNVVDSNDTYAEIIGNGTSDNARSNARTLDWQGNERLAGGQTLFAGTANELDVANAISAKQDALTAGSNVQINNNIISATDTKPDNFYSNDSFSDVTNMATGGTWKECGKFQIDKGTWLVSVALQYPSNATGMRSVGMYIDSSSSAASDVTGIVYQQTLQAANGGATNIVLTQLIEVSDTRYIHIMGRQTSGSAMGTTTSPIRVRARALRFKQ